MTSGVFTHFILQQVKCFFANVFETLPGHIGELHGNVVGLTSSESTPLMVALTLAVLPKMQYCFYLLIFPICRQL